MAGTAPGSASSGGLSSSDRYAGLLVLGVVTMLFLLAGLAAAAAAWLLPGTGDPQELRAARDRQGLLAGSVAGAVCGLLLTNFFVIAVVMMVIGPLVGASGGAVGGFAAADHPPRSRPARSWAAGLFVRFLTKSGRALLTSGAAAMLTQSGTNGGARSSAPVTVRDSSPPAGPY
jgi:hypothetical protein